MKADGRGRRRGRLYWSDAGQLDRCPNCQGELETIEARRQTVLPDRFATKRAAERRLARELVAAADGEHVEPSKLTVAEYLQAWLPTMRATVRPSTYLAYELHVRRIVPLIGHLRLQALTTADIERMYARLVTENGASGHPLAPATCRAVHGALHRALAKAAKERRIPRNPADGAQRPRVEQPEMRAWTREQAAAFLALTESDRLGPLWRLLLTTGMRRGEALGLRWSDVDLEAGRLTVQRSRGQVGYEVREQGTKTRRSRRSVKLDSTTVRALRRQSQRQLDDAAEWGAAWTESGYLFTREDGLPWHPDRVVKLFQAAVKAAGMEPIRLHDLRHTYATLALQAGVPLKVVSENLGHSSIAITADTYSHVTPTVQESAAELVAALVDSGVE